MKKIICQDLKKKRKVKISLDWMSTNGAVNPNQLSNGSQIKIHKNISFNQRHGKEKYSQNIQILKKFHAPKEKDGMGKLSSVYSEKIKDFEYNKLLLKTLERNRTNRNNNKFNVSCNVDDKERVEEVLNEAVISGIKDKIVSKARGIQLNKKIKIINEIPTRANWIKT
jgi:hypothetical protein